MTDKFYYFEEPLLEFKDSNTTCDPHDGLALFGPAEPIGSIPPYIVIGTDEGLSLWNNWVDALNSPNACIDPQRHRAWPPYPGFEVAFGALWPQPYKKYGISRDEIDTCSRKSDKNERAYEVSNLFLSPIDTKVGRLDIKPSLAICIVPDEVYQNCRIQATVSDTSDEKKSNEERFLLKEVIKDHNAGQERLFDDGFSNLQQYGLSPDFRRQIKARVMSYDLPVQIIRESTLQITEQVAKGEPGTNPLSDRLWNFGTALFYKCGRKPWITPWARDGVCYIGLAYKRDQKKKNTACCAAQMFLDSGDGIVFVGEFGPWYSEEKKEFHLSQEAAKKLLSGTIKTYKSQDGRPLKEIFLHSRSGINSDEFKGFQQACPDDVNLIGIRVRKDKYGLRLFRHDNHPIAAQRGKHPVLRGTFWQRSLKHGLLFTTGFKPRIATYDGWEIPVPLAITIQHGKADIVQVAKDILGLTKLNYNTCQLGESQPITVKYSDRIGDILLANPDIPTKDLRHNLKYYI